jgi:hypothetical protein
MRTSLATAACAALALAVPAFAAGPIAALRLVTTQPLVVRGVHFKGHERVRVTEHMGTDKSSKLVRASAAGTFKVTFAAPMAIDPCLESVRVSAVGARGSDALLKLPQRACPPA